jgi:predicted kinase
MAPCWVAIFSGLPGTGKTSLAEATGRCNRVPVFSVAWILGALAPLGLSDPVQRRAVAYGLLTMLIGRQLDLGQSAIVDGMCGQEAVRREWRALTQDRDALFLPIECVCGDRDLHRQRIEQREDPIPGWPDPGWKHVRAMHARYEPWTTDRLVLDSIEPFRDNYRAALRYIEAALSS